MTSPVRMAIPEDGPSEKVAMASPVRMEMDDTGGSSNEDHTYKYAIRFLELTWQIPSAHAPDVHRRHDVNRFALYASNTAVQTSDGGAS